MLLVVIACPGCITWSYGLAPVHPGYGETVTEFPPSLEWVPSAEPAEAVVYDLVVFDSRDAVAYEASNIQATRHTLPATLPEGRYTWTVRPLHLRAGRWVPGPWNRRKYIVPAIVFWQWGTQIYSFKLPDNATRMPAPREESD